MTKWKMIIAAFIGIICIIHVNNELFIQAVLVYESVKFLSF